MIYIIELSETVELYINALFKFIYMVAHWPIIVVNIGCAKFIINAHRVHSDIIT